eukprot:TRINITY_DN66662_c12_g3_i1.p1 TRINITY_DN66662_c12_g3~~TRINITY_DN66662_c12_g3_i1.p1  ORF type:complete len:450 (+),score=38.76 TRINITY_DN66662_c12_g3_i1:33-1352(+)
MHNPKRKPGSKFAPPPLQHVSREDSIDKLGVQISDNGTLQMVVQDGKTIAVRSWGSVAIDQQSNNREQSDSHGVGGQFKWDDLKLGHVIGEGSQAKVRKVKHVPTQTIYALKSIALNKEVTKRTLQQELARVLDSKKHPNVVHSAEAFYIDGALKILMEYMDLGTLSSVVAQAGPLPENILSAIMRQILKGLESLHGSEILHRDIKPSNLLVSSSGIVKISDFGVSTMLTSVNNVANSLVGSTPYMSPERIRAQPYDASSDIWSIGLTAGQCAVGVFPFVIDNGDNDKSNRNPFENKPNVFDLATMIAESRAKIDFDMIVTNLQKYNPERAPAGISDELKDFVWSCMVQNPADRPDCKTLLQHEFILKWESTEQAAIAQFFKEKGVVPVHRAKDKSKSSHSSSAASASGGGGLTTPSANDTGSELGTPTVTTPSTSTPK